MDGNIRNQEPSHGARGWGRYAVWTRGQGQEDIPLYSLSYFLVFEPCECITYLKNKGDLKSLTTLHTHQKILKVPSF